METMQITEDRVRNASSENKNQEIDRKIEEKIALYRTQDESAIRERIMELDKEWDIERTLELNASLIALTGILLSITVNQKWIILPAVVTSFLAQHAIQGWCPPLPLFREMNIRTRKEIDKEKYGLINILENR